MVREAQEDGPFGAQPGEFQNDAAGVAGGALLPQPSAHGGLQQGEPGAVGPGGGQGRRHRDIRDPGGMHGLGDQDGEAHLERVDAGVDLLEHLRIRFVQVDAVAFELLDGQPDEAGGLSIDDGAVGGLAHGPIVPCADGLLVHNRPLILGLWSHWA